jgi:hypothetical protein
LQLDPTGGKIQAQPVGKQKVDTQYAVYLVRQLAFGENDLQWCSFQAKNP